MHACDGSVQVKCLPGRVLIGTRVLLLAGQLDYNGSLAKFLTGAVRRRNIYVAKTKLRIGPMVSFDSKTDDIVGGLLLKKHTAIGSNFDLWLKIAASAEVNTRTKQVRCQP